MKVFVTGVKGQLGYDVVNELEKRGLEAIGVDIQEMDITDADSVNNVIGEAAPVGTSVGTTAWEIRLEELIPVGSPEFASATEPCVIKILTEDKTEIYSGCRWTQVSREFTKQGLRRIRKGVALQKEEQ